MMKVFADTNIFAEYTEQRDYAEEINKILFAVENGNFELYMSVGSLYTLCYLTERALKKRDIHKPTQTVMLREILKGFLDISHLVPVSQDNANAALLDENYSDLEDSLQYQCAKENGCDIILTINNKDFKVSSEDTIRVMTPLQFVEQYS